MRCAYSSLAILACCLPGPVFAQDPPKLRLDGNARPREYSASLRIVPDEDFFSGTIDIDLEIRRPTKLIWLHAVSLTLKEATLNDAAAKIVPGGADFQGLAFEQPATSGRLHIVYSGPISRKSSGGVFQMKDGAHWYVYSQFEPIDARRAFPCFDEPSYKAPWQLTLEVKREQMALSNTPMISEAMVENGMKKIRFEKTKPLPSYLVAFAVGPFEAVTARSAGAKKTPVRIIVPQGRRAEAEFAARTTPEVLERLEAYFGIPYPYEKLDSVAVPLFIGAMENPGLITYDLSLILSKPSEDTISRQRGYTRVATHEQAHQWFGDLVTTGWWDDIWLNEAFATWMVGRVLADWKPDWGIAESSVSSRLGAMGQDGMISARRIRQPIESKNDIVNAFDGITYQKGAAVIGMFESWVGPENFRRGVKSYLDQFSFRNATAADFVAAIGRATERDLTRPFSTFLDQPGVPVVTMALRCENGSPPVLSMSQKRSLPKGSKGSTNAIWQIPVCVAYQVGQKRQRDCTLLTSQKADWKLTGATGCPAWLIGNEAGTGYYHVRYEGDLLARALAGAGSRLTLPERISTLGDTAALARSGDVPPGQALELVPVFSHDANRQIVSSTIRIAGSVDDIVPAALRPNYARFVGRMYGERAARLGWKSKPGEDDETRLLRPEVLGLVAGYGDDPAPGAEAVRLARLWLADHTAVQPDMVGAALSAAARNGDETLFNAFVETLKATRDQNGRGRLIGALSSFRNPALANRAMGMLLGSEIDPREGLQLLFGPMGDAGTRELPFAFVKRNYDALVAKLPDMVGSDMAAFLPFSAAGLCSAERIPEVKSFFEERMKARTGGPRNLAQALESIELCDATQRAQQAAVAEFLKRY